jgi:AMP deaminase
MLSKALRNDSKLESCCDDISSSLGRFKNFIPETNENEIGRPHNHVIDSFAKHGSRDKYEFRMENGIMRVYRNGVEQFENSAPKVDEFRHDFEFLIQLTLNNGPLSSYCSDRLNEMVAEYDDYQSKEWHNEHIDQTHLRLRDLYTVAKVDNHVHGGSVIPVEMFIGFVKEKYQSECNTPVYQEPNGQILTLCQLFKSENITFNDLNINALNLHGDKVRNRFDYFLEHIYQPFGSEKLGTVFLQYDNYIGGRFYAEILRKVFVNFPKYNVYSEIRVPVFGVSYLQWSTLANWIDKYDLLNDDRVQWVIEVWALSSANANLTEVHNYEDVLSNIFLPLFEATVNPQSNPTLSRILKYMTFFDNDSGEGIESSPFFDWAIPPQNIINPADAPFVYQIYYTCANIAVLNQLRR